MTLNKKKIILNILLILSSILITFFLINLLVSINILSFFNQKNLPRHWSLNSDRYFLTFYPNTHDKTLKNYTALLGASNVFGEGDGWVNDIDKYSFSHYLRDYNNKNYLNFGKPGANSITSIKEFFFTMKNIKKSFFLPTAENPKEIILSISLNDFLGNNILYKEKADSKVIKKFVEDEISNLSSYNHRIINLYLPLLKSSSQVLKEKLIHYVYLGIIRNLLVSLNLKPSRKIITTNKTVDKNKIFIDENEFIFPDVINNSYLLLNEKEIETGIEILFESVKYLKKNYPETSLKIVLIPDALHIYKWKYPITIKNNYLKREKILINDEKLKTWDLISNEVKIFSKNQKITFIDLKSELSKIGEKEYIHGIRDPRHLSVNGYKYVARILNEQVIKSK
tara:strand:- start:53 stop:1240 length:1188 start_codon:yes stop_codon:yes gene_type:complete